MSLPAAWVRAGDREGLLLLALRTSPGSFIPLFMVSWVGSRSPERLSAIRVGRIRAVTVP
jgi:hypothetical protein